MATAALCVGCGNDPAVPPLECGLNLATDEELALTPRQDTNLEELAIVATERVVAGEVEYARVLRDVAAIRGMRPDLESIGFLAAFQQEIIIRADEATIAQMATGAYPHWDCLNERFKVSGISSGAGTPDRLDLSFDGIYHIPTLAARYSVLPQVESASGGLSVGDGSTLCLTPGEDTWHYVVDKGVGNCESGCVDHDYSYFITTVDGTVLDSGSWATQSSDPKPQWVTNYVTPRACHGIY